MRSLRPQRFNGDWCRNVAIAIKFVVYVLEGLFAAGILGSAVVILLTSIEDSEVLFTKSREPAVEAQTPVSQQD
jgi:hypothetical protein